MKLKGRYVATIEIDLETEETENDIYNKAVKEYWTDIHDNVTGKLLPLKHKFTNIKVTQQLFDMYEVKR